MSKRMNPENDDDVQIVPAPTRVKTTGTVFSDLLSVLDDVKQIYDNAPTLIPALGTTDSINDLIPYVIVVGDQSAGKSSFLSSIIDGTKLPVGNGRTTFCAIEIRMRTSNIVKGSVYAKNLNTGETAVVHDMIDNPEAINTLHTEIYNYFGGGEFRTDWRVVMEVTGPTKPNMTVIDLPGLFAQGNQEYQIPLQIINNFINKPNCLVINVVGLHIDLVLNTSIPLVKKFDPNYTRTLTVYTQIDGSKNTENSFREALTNDRKGILVQPRKKVSDGVFEDTTEQEELNLLSAYAGNGIEIGRKTAMDKISKFVRDKIEENKTKLIASFTAVNQHVLKELETIGRNKMSNHTVHTRVMRQVERVLNKIISGSNFETLVAVRNNIDEEINRICSLKLPVATSVEIVKAELVEEQGRTLAYIADKSELFKRHLKKNIDTLHPNLDQLYDLLENTIVDGVLYNVLENQTHMSNIGIRMGVVVTQKVKLWVEQQIGDMKSRIGDHLRVVWEQPYLPKSQDAIHEFYTEHLNAIKADLVGANVNIEGIKRKLDNLTSGDTHKNFEAIIFIKNCTTFWSSTMKDLRATIYREQEALFNKTYRMVQDEVDNFDDLSVFEEQSEQTRLRERLLLLETKTQDGLRLLR
jgi:hypothetical protein